MKNLNTIILKETPVEKFKNKLSQVFLFLCILFFVITLSINITYSVAPVYGTSMQPTLNINFTPSNASSQDKVVLNYIKKYQRGDIIVAKKNAGYEASDYYVIKRLIAIEGDKLLFQPNGDIYLNDKKLNEDYVKQYYLEEGENHPTYENILRLKQNKPELFENNALIIPKNKVFFLGDNRAASSDCSIYGPVDKSEIIAKVDYIIKANENIFLSVLKQIFS